jgi:hypothetical protein
VGRTIITAVPSPFAVDIVGTSTKTTVGIPHQYQIITATGVITAMAMIAKI